MTLNKDIHNSDLEAQSQYLGYLIHSITPLKEINGYLYMLHHSATGARHLHISTQDKENTFGVTFKTVPTDSTGVAHILEHTVLCGSEKYPVRDPFFSMLKRSLSTFMNAFTASDWTMYPFSTQNRKDYYNLMDVYLDAAFFPSIDELSFKQEGHRLELSPPRQQSDNHITNGNAESALVYKGVVYNEMKGAMSSPDQVMVRSILNALYPDTTYGNNSGGDPKKIPQLTHAQLKAFHQRHYHPSNAYFYTYGNLPLIEHLEFIDQKIMGRFEAIDPNTDVPRQPKWPQPKTARYTYALTSNQLSDKKSQICIAWLLSDIRDTFDALVLTVLEQILMGNAASPLRKALMDSGLGSALSDGSGFDADNRDTLFACGLKDTDESCADEIEKITFDVFHQLIRDGIDRELIDSAIHQIEFHRKEITNTPYPYGLKLLLTIIGSWLHGGDPKRVLQLDEDLKSLHEKIDSGPFLENCIKIFFIDNTHRIRMVLSPDYNKAEKEEKRVSQELRQRLSQLNPQEIEQIQHDAAALQSLQEASEDISILPTLELSDIPADIPEYSPSGISTRVPLWSYTQPTSGIVYFSGTTSAILPPALLTWVPFFCYAFTKIGTDNTSYTQIARKIDAVTGGFSLTAHARAPYNRHQDCLPLVSLKTKCLARNINPMLDLAEELIGSIAFKDLTRLKQLLGEYQAGLESMIVHNGHRLAISLASRMFSQTSALSEIWTGVHQLRSIRQFNQHSDDAGIETLSRDLLTIAGDLFQPHNFIMSAIADKNDGDQVAQQIESRKVLSKFRRDHQRPEMDSLEIDIEENVPYEGWSTSSAVAFVARTVPTAPMDHPDAPTLAVLSKLLRSLYLHREIREKGGAYGGFALYNPENGLFSLASYRDPHIERTLGIFEGVREFMASEKIDSEDIKEAVLQVCSEIDKPDSPGAAAQKAFSRLIVGLKDEDRLKFKQQLLKVTPEKLVAAADQYFKPRTDKAGIAVIAGEEHLKQANKQLTTKPLRVEAI
jgi:Zn-dependent M16 (insulinase) family peptidase